MLHGLHGKISPYFDTPFLRSDSIHAQSPKSQRKTRSSCVWLSPLGKSRFEVGNTISLPYPGKRHVQPFFVFNSDGFRPGGYEGEIDSMSVKRGQGRIVLSAALSDYVPKTAGQISELSINTFLQGFSIPKSQRVICTILG
ncbi:hypothetical protein XENOCAPTIV_023319 [Xenoophorus captivus]|uniref:Uncharacterized protein n=1 Tax=Xenoophorus captivus TaxID=1517983 RepID=A0ABV0SI09_9TELE